VLGDGVGQLYFLGLFSVFLCLGPLYQPRRGSFRVFHGVGQLSGDDLVMDGEQYLDKIIIVSWTTATMLVRTKS